jgi:hypothetical protein
VNHADDVLTGQRLGNALATLGERESDPARLQEAVTAFREALKEWTREKVPLDWATAQNSLGNVLVMLGERESDPARLQEAVRMTRWPSSCFSLSANRVSRPNSFASTTKTMPRWRRSTSAIC